MFWFLLASFQWLVFGGQYKSFSPSLLWRLLVPPTKTLILKPFVSSPQHLFVRFEWFVINPCLGWEIPLCEWFEHLSFVKQTSWHLLLLEVKPPRRLGVALELPRLWWVMGKFVKVRFASARKGSSASEVRKEVERDPTWSWLLVGNSSYLNGDVGITWCDSELWQTNHHVHPLICLSCVLALLFAWLTSCHCLIL
jgi:hypothetical protein